MTRILTADEIALCDQFQTFMRSLFYGPMGSFSVTAYAAKHGDFYSSSVQDGFRAYSPPSNGSFAENIQACLDIFHERHAADERAKRIAELRAELEQLEQAA